MYIYFDRNGTIKEVINDESIRRGSNDYNKIYCYLEGNPDIDDIWYLQKNPVGTLTNEVSFVDNIVKKAIPYDAKRDMKYFQDFEEYQFYVFTLSSSYLLQSGLVVATIRVVENNTLWALGELTFNVQANIVKSDNDITQSQYDYLLLKISSYYSKTEIDNKLDLKADKATAVTHDGNQLKDYNGNNIYPDALNVVDLMNWAIGSLSQNGEDASSDRRVRSDLYKFENNVIVKKTNNEFKYNVFVFTKIDNTYTCISYDNFQKDTCILNSELYYRFVIGKKTNEKITVNEAKASLVINNYYYNNKNTPKPVIVDTDWWTDSDDSMAIRTALWAEREGMIDILGFNINAVKNTSVTSLARLIDSEGRKNYAIGYDTQATDYDGGPSYHQVLIDNYNYYSIYDTNSKAQDSVAFYRRMLVSLPTGVKCNIISVGYLNSLSRLINSLPDKYSTLTGLELLKSKVDTIYIMGGNYPSGSENNFNRSQRAINSAIDIVNSDLLPVCIKFLGHEMASSILVGGQIKDTIGTDDLIYKCLVAHGGSYEGNNGRNGWDPLTTLYACYNNAERMLFNEIQGNNVVNNDGSNTFTTNPSGKHFYCTKKKGNYWYQYILNTILNLNENTNRNDLTRLSITPYYNSVITNDWIKYKLLTNSITVPNVANNNNCKLNKIGGMSYKSNNKLNLSNVIQDMSNNNNYYMLLSNFVEGTYTISLNATMQNINVDVATDINKSAYSSLLRATDNNTATITITSSILANYSYIFFAFKVNDSWNNDLTNYNVMVNEGSTALPYQTYFEGIRDSAITSVKSNGANLFNSEDVVSGYMLNSENSLVEDSSYFYCNYIKVNPSTTYRYNLGISFHTCFYDINKTYISGTTYSDTFTTPSNCYYMRMSATLVSLNTLMIVKGSTAPSKYLPYRTPITKAIPTAVQNLSGYGKGISQSVCNYEDFEIKKFVKMVGSYTFTGNENFFYESTGRRWTLSNMQEIQAKNGTSNIITDIPNIFRFGSTYQIDNSIYVGVEAFQIADSTNLPSTMAKEQVASYLAGKTIYYELATPVETDVSAYISTNVLTTATSGTISFNNTYSQKVPVDIDLLLEI